ncbi:N-acetylmuramoyl-L-alanine amidase [candidate division WOR-3 bacterium]|jgi:N-acetylmuramoyl-L-alanine amidase|nr:N-acetylmuramoyl-L-alanine amidase [candidate division WOR-3 bacterium]
MQKIALVIGHTEKSPGAINTTCGVSEFDFNRKLVTSIAAIIDDRCEVKIVYRERYSDLPEKINAWNPDFVICFHANAFNGRVMGAETLFYHKSKKGKEMATIFQSNIVKALGLKDRGIKGKSSEQRGGYVLRFTEVPCILIEPFFIDNDDDYKTAVNKYPELVGACVDSIYEIIETI